MEAFLSDMERTFRDMHFPEATQALTGLQRDFGHVVIDRGEICIVGLEGQDFDATACAVTVLKASADVAMLDWQKTLYHKCCHITIDLNPDAANVSVQTPPDIDLALHFGALSQNAD